MGERNIGMKKILLFISLCSLIMILFTSCSGKPYSFKEPVDEIESIEIVSAENSLEFTVTKTLSETEKEDFLEQFQGIKFNKYLGDPPAVHGDAIKINYQNGDYEMICYYSAEYVTEGVTQFLWKRCDEADFNELLNNFLE